MNTLVIRSKKEVNDPIIEIHRANGEIRTLCRERRPSQGAIRRLIKALQCEPKLLLTRIDESVLEQAFIMGSAVAYCRFVGKSMRIEAFGALWPSKSQNFLELGTTWVLPEYRGIGVAKAIFEICDELVPQISLFLLTANRAIVKIALNRGWRWEDDNWNVYGTFPWLEEIIGPLLDRYHDPAINEPKFLLYRKPIQRKIILHQA